MFIALHFTDRIEFILYCILYSKNGIDFPPIEFFSYNVVSFMLVPCLIDCDLSSAVHA